MHLPELPDPSYPSPVASQRVIRRLRADIEETHKGLSYLDRLIHKPWGSEYRVYEDDLRDVWCLHIWPGQRTSLHCHRRKLTALLCLEGHGTLTTGAGVEYALEPGVVLQIEPGASHRSAADSKMGLRLIEVETPKDKFDLLRIQDDYERTSKPYEGARKDAVPLALYPLVEQLAANASARVRAQCSTGRYRFALETGQQIVRQPVGLVFAIALEPRPSTIREVTVLGAERASAADDQTVYLTIRITL